MGESILSDELVSVIIPAYNAEKTIEKCINSITTQNYSSLEIIIVDDGSADLTVQICKNLANLDRRIKTIQSINKGVSHARNIGIENSHGNWIVFVDADDWIKSDFIQTAIKKQNLNNCDTCCFNAVFVREGEYQQMKPIQPPKKVYQGEEIEILKNTLYIPQQTVYPGDFFRAVWGKLLSARIIRENGIRFSENIKIGEDALFLFDYFSKAKKIYIEDASFYFYLVSNPSATRKYRDNYELVIRDEYEQMRKRFSNNEFNCREASICFWRTASGNYLANQLRKNEGLFLATEIFEDYLRNEDGTLYLKMFRRGDTFKTKVMVILYRLNLYKLVGFIKALKIHKIQRSL